MDDKPKASLVRPTYGWVWLAIPLVLFAVYEVLGLFDRTTEITPNHDTVLNACFAVGGFAALLFAGVGAFGHQKTTAGQRVILATALAMLGFSSVFLLSERLAELAENHIDFPASSTRTFRLGARTKRTARGKVGASRPCRSGLTSTSLGVTTYSWRSTVAQEMKVPIPTKFQAKAIFAQRLRCSSTGARSAC